MLPSWNKDFIIIIIIIIIIIFITITIIFDWNKYKEIGSKIWRKKMLYYSARILMIRNPRLMVGVT